MGQTGRNGLFGRRLGDRILGGLFSSPWDWFLWPLEFEVLLNVG